MSTQSEREAAARAWFANSTHATAHALVDAIQTRHGYACPDAEQMGTALGALSAWLAWAKADAAPVAPAMTLDAMREAAKAHGYRLVHESGYEAPATVLAYITHALTLSDADGDRYLECFDDIEDGDKPAERAAMAVEAASLRALGVTPAVLK